MIQVIGMMILIINLLHMFIKNQNTFGQNIQLKLIQFYRHIIILLIMNHINMGQKL